MTAGTGSATDAILARQGVAGQLAPAHRPGVLIVVPWDQALGGVASVVDNLATHLLQRGHEVIFLHPGEAGGVEERITALGYPGYRLILRSPVVPGRPLRSRVAFALTLPLTLYRLLRIVRRHGVEVVNVHYPVDTFAAVALLRRLSKSTLVTSVHGADIFPKDRSSRRHSSAVRRLLGTSDLVVTPSHSYRKALLSAFPDLSRRTAVVHNGVDPKLLDRGAATLATPVAAPYLLCIAALSKWKGIDVLLRAFSRVGQENPNLRLALVGDGGLRGELEMLAESLGIRARTDFLGWRGRTEIGALLHGCEVFVLPSRAEPFGLAAAEAMVCGKPVVASAVGGLREVVDDDVTGVLVPPDDSEALAEALFRLLRNPGLRASMGEAGKRRVSAYFRTDQMGEAYADHFLALTEKGEGERHQARTRWHSAPAEAKWEIGIVCPANWTALAEGFDAGFIHTPPALEISAPPGTPMYAKLRQGGRVIAIAAGTTTRCRLGGIHAYLPAPPAVGPEVSPETATRLLLDAMRAHGAAEVVVDSFDAPWPVPLLSDGAVLRLRLEHRVPLCTDPDELARRFGRTHRRHLARGEREGWSVRPLHGQEASAAVRAVQGFAAARADHRGDPFSGQASTQAFGGPAGDPSEAWGTTTFAAFGGEELLAAALVGWGNRRAFYLIGGSTPEGYRQSAAVWLHWRVMATLAEHGHTVYNLGGTPAAAVSPDHPSHGLHRFKTGFGSEQVECRGARWEIRSLHQHAHRMAARVSRLLEIVA